jgi:MFS family permease
VGIAEAAILTCATAMIGDYFVGARRNRWLALQTGTAPVIATLMLALGGALGEQGWRIPFVAYGVTAIFVPVGLFCLWEPTRTVSSQPTESVVESPSMRWAPFLGICAITIFATTAFLVPIIQFAFLASERGMTSPASIGLWGAVSSVANMLGAVLFIAIRVQVKAKLALSFAAMGVGFAIMALGPGSESVVVGAAVANLGSGCIVPTLITWALAGLAPTHRGMGTGLWMSANFLGQFLSPLIVLLLVRSLGTLDQAILVYAVFCGVAALMSLGARLWRSN